MRIDSSYPTPIYGVSTLSPRNRARGQASLQENLRSDPVNKLTRRQSSKWVKLLMTGINTDDVKFHSYERNNKEFDILLTNNTLKVFVNNNERIVSNPNGINVSSLAVGGSYRGIIAQTINDVTILANPNTKVLMEEVTDIVPNVSYINVISALNYGEKVTVLIKVDDPVDGLREFQVQHVVPNIGTSPPNYDVADRQRATAQVAASLAQQIGEIGSGVIGWDCDDYGSCTPIMGDSYGIEAYVKGSVVAVKNTTGNTKLTVEILAGQGSKSCVAINEINSDIEGLPLYAIVDSTITIKPNPTTDRGTYYLKATQVSDITSTEVLQEVTWVESRKVTDEHKFVQSTLPIELTYDQVSDTFTLNYMNLEERKTGDSETNKKPAFVNSFITGISYFQKRLVIVSENNVSMTNTDNIYDFFKKSSVQLLVTDPIGIASTYTEVDFINYIIPHNRDLMFIAKNGQFKIDGSIAVTPQTVSMPLTTSYETETSVAPVSFGNSVLLPMSFGDSCGIQEFRREKNVDNDVAHQLSNHIIGYMKGKPSLLVSNSNLEMFIMKSDESLPNELFVFEQYSEYGEHRQRSWSKWVFPEQDRILSATFNNSIIRLIVREGSNIVLKEIELYAKVITNENEVFLDNRYKVEALTLIVLPVGYPWNENSKVICSDRSKFPLVEAVITSNELSEDGTRIITVERETTGNDNVFFVGEPFISRYRPTRPFRYTENNIAITTDRIRIGRFIVNVVDTSIVKFKTVSKFYPELIQEFNSRIVGTFENLLDTVPFYTGDIIFPFAQDAELAEAEIFTDGWLNMTISGLAWAGQYHQTSQRM